MRKMEKKRLIAGFMAFTITFTSMHWDGIYLKDIFAAGETKEISADEVIVSEEDAIKSENTKNSTTFDIGDGRKKVVYYGSDVRYKDGKGTLIDYDPSLTDVKEETSKNGEDLTKYVYENAEGDKKQYLPQTLSIDTPVLMESGNHSIRFSPLIGSDQLEKEGTTNVENLSEKKTEQNDFASVQKAESPVLRKETTTDAYEQEIEKPLTAVYDAGDDMDIEYQSMEDGVKERIVLEEEPDTGVFQYEIQTDGLEVRKNATNEGLTFYESDTDRIVAFMESPNMNDASGNAYSEDITCDLEEKEGENGTYILTMRVNQNYLSDSKRTYPVTIDPTMTWKGNDSLRDVYVISGSTYGDINFYDSGVVAAMAGKTSKGIYLHI